MHKTQDYFEPPMNGIWGKTELPALYDETDVEEVGSFSRLSSRQLPAFLRSDFESDR